MMSARDKARRSDSIYYDTNGVHRRHLCDMIAEREARIEELEAENAKLRELVRGLYEYRQLYFKTGIYPTDHGVTEQRMRELGVEVDG